MAVFHSLRDLRFLCLADMWNGFFCLCFGGIGPRRQGGMHRGMLSDGPSSDVSMWWMPPPMAAILIEKYPEIYDFLTLSWGFEIFKVAYCQTRQPSISIHFHPFSSISTMTHKSLESS